MTRRPVALILLAAAAVTVLAACGRPSARLTYNDTEKVKVTEILVSGGAGNVTVKASAIEDTRITRIVQSSHDPGQSYTLQGTTLSIDTDCGPDCTVSYEIEAPTGVAVRGELASGDIGLTGVGVTDIRLTSGDIAIRGATGAVQARTTSGDIDVFDAAQGVTLEAKSGNVQAMNVAGVVVANATSGDVDVKLAEAGSVTASAGSGNVELIVPTGDYRVEAAAGSGDEELVGIVSDPSAKNVIDVRAGSGDVRVVTAPEA
jgi:hypothetical protein